jgi:hypothetical protein
VQQENRYCTMMLLARSAHLPVIYLPGSCAKLTSEQHILWAVSNPMMMNLHTAAPKVPAHSDSPHVTAARSRSGVHKYIMLLLQLLSGSIVAAYALQRIPRS